MIVCALFLDVQYTHDEAVTPLMSAVVVWNAMDKVVTDATLHNTVKRLLFVQVGTLQITKYFSAIPIHPIINVISLLAVLMLCFLCSRLVCVWRKECPQWPRIPYSGLNVNVIFHRLGAVVSL